MGNLNNNQNHRLPEPLREPELFLTEKPEAGFQAKYKNRLIDIDSWIDWQKFILPGDAFKEHLSSDLVPILRYINLIRIQSRFLFYNRLPLQGAK